MRIVQQIPDRETVIQVALAWIQGHPNSSAVIGSGVLLLVAIIADVIAKRRIVAFADLVVRRTKVEWDDIVHRTKVFDRLSHLLPPLVVYFGVGLVPNIPDKVVAYVQQGAAAILVVIATISVGAVLSAINDIYERSTAGRVHPIKVYVQVAKIIVYALGAVIAVAAFMNKSPLLFLSGLGAMAAVLMLVFKDTLLSLVASVQIMSNDMIRVGDWVEMPKYNADGDVIDIALHTVKFRNWDNTITTVPTSKFIEDSFRNWRGMSESGARRIKRSIIIDQRTIRFLTEDEIEKLKNFALLKDYVEKKEAEIKAFNEKFNADTDDAEVRHLTNIGTFRAYLVNYLKNHPKIHQDQTVLVRQLAPTPDGLPLEIYVFSNDTAWVAYEGIQSDIFDHMFAVMGKFGLSVFQNPTGADFQNALSTPAKGE